MISNDQELVFCHNDLLILNILVLNDETIKLIDFEYCGYNSYLCDIYNLLIENTYIIGEEFENGFIQDLSKFGSNEDIINLITLYQYYS